MDDTQKNDGTGEEDVDEDWRSPSQLKSPVVRGPEPIYGFGAQQLAIALTTEESGGEGH